MEFFITTRRLENGKFGTKQGSLKFLAVPADSIRIVKSHSISKARWFKAVQAASGAKDGSERRGSVVVNVHGFNVDQSEMRERHKLVEKGLRKQGYKGAVVSFDWPSDGNVLGYPSDRLDARWAATFLMRDGIAEFARLQRADCQIDVNVLAHSMGAFIVREAFDFADDEHAVAKSGWVCNQVVFVAADISAKSMARDSPSSSSLLRRSVRLTNYYSGLDEVLSISSVKRLGLANRLGRVGLPEGHSSKAVNVYCAQYYKDHVDDFGTSAGDTHGWYFRSTRFYEDLMHTYAGKIDRDEFPTRTVTSRGNSALI